MDIFYLNKRSEYRYIIKNTQLRLYKIIPPCPYCGKDDFKKTQDRDIHLN